MRFLKKYFTIGYSALLILLLFIACSDRKTGSHENQVSGDSLGRGPSTISQTDSLNTSFRISGDSVLIPGFIIALNLSDKAEKELKDQHESVIVQAYFAGEPKDTTTEEYIENGELNVGSYRIELFDKRIAKFENVKIAKTSLDALKDKNFEVLINVFSGRHATDLNILDCDILQEKILTVAGKKFVLNGKLIEEN